MRKGWSIDPDDWNRLQQALAGTTTWHSVLLTPNDRHIVPDSPGIYAICAPPPIILRTASRTMFHSLASPIYIGRSESSIRARFVYHCSATDQELRRAKRCYNSVQLRFWFVELPPPSVRDTEAWLIDCFGPPVNRLRGTITGTLGQPIDV